MGTTINSFSWFLWQPLAEKIYLFNFSSCIFIFYVLHIWTILIMKGAGPLQLILNSICFLLGKILLLCNRKMMSLFSMMSLKIDSNMSRIFFDTPHQCFDNTSYYLNHDLLKLHWRICSPRRPLHVSEIVHIFWKVFKIFWIKIALLC